MAQSKEELNRKARERMAAWRQTPAYQDWLVRSREQRIALKTKYRRLAGVPPKKQAKHDSHVKSREAWKRKQAKQIEADRKLSVKKFFFNIGMKLCRSCGLMYGVSDFYRDSSSIDGLMDQCKSCDLERIKKNRKANPDKHRESNRKYAATEKAAASAKKWRHSNSDKVREARRKSDKKRRQNPLYKLKQNIRKAIRDSLKKNGYTKRSRTHEILGCDYEAFVHHIEKQFTKGMMWDKLGSEIHIDHITPLATAKTEDDVVALNHFTNLRPCWADENLVKSDSIEFLI